MLREFRVSVSRLQGRGRRFKGTGPRSRAERMQGRLRMPHLALHLTPLPISYTPPHTWRDSTSSSANSLSPPSPPPSPSSHNISTPFAPRGKTRAGFGHISNGVLPPPLSAASAVIAANLWRPPCSSRISLPQALSPDSEEAKSKGQDKIHILAPPRVYMYMNSDSGS